MVLIALVFFSDVKTEEGNVLHGYGSSIRDGTKERKQKESCVLITISIERSNGTRMNHKHYLIKQRNERGCHLQLLGLSKYLMLRHSCSINKVNHQA